MIGEIASSFSIALPSAPSEQEALEAVLDDLAPLFERMPMIRAERDAALLVVSDNAGNGTTVRFWRDALAVGLGVASPGPFPWCLANAPCATIARRFGVTGPNVTWLASFDDPTAFDAASSWLEEWLRSRARRGEPSDAWVVALHFGDESARLVAWHWNGTSQPSSEELRATMTSDWHR